MTERDLAVRRVLLIELLLNLLVAGAKGVYGFISGSLSISADAVHSLVDAGANIVGIAVLREAAQPPDPEHPYGHRKFEVIAASLLGLAVGAVGINLGISAVGALLDPQPPKTSIAGIVVILGTLVVNVFVASYEARKAKELESDFLAADAAHTASDILVTGTVLLSFLASHYGILWADAIGALFVVVVIMRVAWSILRRNLGALVDEAPVDANHIVELAMEVQGVRSCHKVRSRGLRDDFTVDLHLALDGACSLTEAHEVAHKVRTRIQEELPEADVTIQLEPDRRKEQHDLDGPNRRTEPYSPG